MTSSTIRSRAVTGAATLALWLVAAASTGAPEGGLYIAGDGFSFQQAAARALAENTGSQRFFVLALPPNTTALARTASKSDASLRDRVIAAGGTLLVCQRDVDAGSIDAAQLVPGVVAVRGFPPPGSDAIPPGERYFPDENRQHLPQATEALRRLRATCS